MIVRYLLAMTAISCLLAAPAGAQEALVTYKSLSPELAQDLARQRWRIAGSAAFR